MKINRLIELLSKDYKEYGTFIPLEIFPEEIFPKEKFPEETFPVERLKIYPRSINSLDNHYFFIARSGNNKYLYILFPEGNGSLALKFRGDTKRSVEPRSATKKYIQGDRDTVIKCCPLNHENAIVIQELFEFTRPVLLGTENSFGFGDRLGLANPAHVQAVEGSNLRPVFAQQSIRELERTERSPGDVMDSAVWAVFGEGYREGFGSDADHLKSTDDIDLMARAGFTMFTFDPGEHVVNDADSFPVDELYARAQKLPWNELDDTFEKFIDRYENVRFTITCDFTLQPDREEILRGIVKYGRVIAHAVMLYRHLQKNYGGRPSEVELSVDETDSPTSLFEHFLIASELKRLGVELVSLAPRFIGDFEKGIDYKGDILRFRDEYAQHLKIASMLGPYKLSLHSGSDKFSIYNVIGQFPDGLFHIKTAGTSYLVALQTVAFEAPSLFREILDFSRHYYETEKKTYHVSADLSKVPSAEKLNDEQLMGLFGKDDARQVLHVTFGRVLTARTGKNLYLFRDRLLKCLDDHEKTHYEFLIQHFHRHIKPLIK